MENQNGVKELELTEEEQKKVRVLIRNAMLKSGFLMISHMVWLFVSAFLFTVLKQKQLLTDDTFFVLTMVSSMVIFIGLQTSIKETTDKCRAGLQEIAKTASSRE